MQAVPLGLVHKDIVHDIAFDFYGKRFVSVAQDKMVKVWDMDENGTWYVPEGAEWQAHNDAVKRACWAHPEFGQLLATCSVDHTVRIWEEQEAPSAEDSSRCRWQQKTQLIEAKRAINDVKFAPRHQGLKLATACADGIVRIYEANDVFSLNYWRVQDQFDSADGTEHGVRCLSWNQSPFDAPTLVAGGCNRSRPSCRVWRYKADARAWICVCEFTGHRLTTDVAWAPNMGRSVHLIASVGNDNLVHVYSLKRVPEGLELEGTQSLQHPRKVCRCAWNATGTVLCTSDDQGIVHLWRRDFEGNWKQVQELQPPTELPQMMYSIGAPV